MTTQRRPSSRLPHFIIYIGSAHSVYYRSVSNTADFFDSYYNISYSMLRNYYKYCTHPRSGAIGTGRKRLESRHASKSHGVVDQLMSIVYSSSCSSVPADAVAAQQYRFWLSVTSSGYLHTEERTKHLVGPIGMGGGETKKSLCVVKKTPKKKKKKDPHNYGHHNDRPPVRRGRVYPTRPDYYSVDTSLI